MPNNKWDEDNIENLLRDFPSIKDERPKEEVYARLEKDRQVKRKPKRWIPYLIAVLAFLTFGALLASTLGQSSSEKAFDMSGSESTEESADFDSHANENSMAESAEMESSTITETEEDSDAFSSMQGDDSLNSSLYNEDIEKQTLFTLGLTENGVVVPISFFIADSRILADFGEDEVDAAKLYNQYAAEVDEEALGFDDYHPYSGTIRSTEKAVQHILPQNHGYDRASASIAVYLNSLSASFPAAGEISVVDETGNPVNFDQVGIIRPVESAVRNVAYYTYKAENGSSYLLPGYDMPYENAEEAFYAMKKSPNDLYNTIIPEGLDFSVSETEEVVTVEFEKKLEADSYESGLLNRMIEGMIFTAESFGKGLILDNTGTESWNGFDFENILPLPYGINVQELP